MSTKYRGVTSTAWISYSNWQKNLVAKNRTQENGGAVPPARTRHQQRFLGISTRPGNGLTAELRQALDCRSEDTLDVPLLNRRLTAEEMWNPQMDWEQMLHGCLSNPSNRAAPVTRRDAAQVLFWVISHVAWLEAGLLQEPPISFLTRKQIGRALLRIDPELLSSRQRLQLDDGVRDGLRSLGGIPHVRSSHIHHLMDGPAARAWWRVEVAAQAVNGSADILMFADCYEVFQRPGLWAAWAETAMTRAGTLSVDACSAGFVEAIRRYREVNDTFPNKAQSQRLIRNMASRTTNVYPQMLSYLQLADVCAE